jgi:hypothetical protein
MTKPDTKKTRLAGGFAAMFKPTAKGDGFVDLAAERPKKPRPRPAAKPDPVAITPAAHLAAIPPPAPDPGAAFGGKLVACFKWQDGSKASAARPSDIPEDDSGPITYKGASGRLPEMMPGGTRAAFLAHCEAAARESGAALHFINAKGGRARKHSRDGKRPSEIGIADGWQRYSVTIRKGHYLELERARAASGLSHKEIVDAALSRELARMKAELKGKK